MKKILLLLSIMFLYFPCISQNYVFVGEFNLNQGNSPEKFTYDYYHNNIIESRLQFKIKDKKTFVDFEKPLDVQPREVFYKDLNQIEKAEVLIKIDESIFIKYGDEFTCRIGFKKKGMTKFHWGNEFKISKYPSRYTSISKPYVLKIQDAIPIGAPEIIGMDVSLNFLKISLDSAKYSYPQYKYTVKELDQFLRRSVDSIFLSYSQFRNLASLLLFLESFNDPHSFMNEEAQKLNNLIRGDSAQLGNLSDNNDKLIAKELYSEYERINRYINFLQPLLYNSNYHTYYKQNTFEKKLSLKSNENIKSGLHFSLGASILPGLTPLYNITLQDTTRIVQFENVSRVNITYSTGILWSFDLGRIRTDSIVKYLKPSLNKRVSFGLIGTYIISPNNKQLPLSSSFGAGLGIGYQIQDFDVLFTTNLRSVWQPREYFINQFKDQNRTLPSLNIASDSIFIRKVNVSLGISFLYRFAKLFQSGFKLTSTQ